MSKRKLAAAVSPRRVRRMGDAAAASARPRVLIVGSGLTGSLTCYHLRQRCGGAVRIDVADMARGAGGRMSTTRWGADSIRANTGAQYVSCCSPEAAALLEAVCAPSKVKLTGGLPIICRRVQQLD